MRTKFIIGLVVILILGVIGWKMYNKPHSDMEAATPDFTLSATELFNDFAQDENKANEKYLDKVIQVRGKVQKINESPDKPTKILLAVDDEMLGVRCEMDANAKHDLSSVNKGEEVALKCKCSGKLMDVVLVRCVLID